MRGPMRVLFSSTRGTGHWQPLLPYARALRALGHEVVMAAPAEVGAAMQEEGLAHAPFDHPGDEALAPVWARYRTAASLDEGNDLAMREIFGGLNAKAALPKLLETIRSWRPHLVVRESAEFGAAVAADGFGIPHARVAAHMVSFEDRLPSVVGEPIDALRRQAGLSPDGGAFLNTEPAFTAFPASLDGPAGAAGRPATLFRVRLLEDQPDLTPPAWLPTDGLPLVYITFGTLVGSSPRDRSVFRTALDAVADLPLHGLVTTGRGVEAATLGTIPTNVRVEAWVPQGVVLPRAAAIVCHGGSGTVRGALASGVPMVVVPMFADQPHNASRVAAVGAGLALSNPDAPALRTALQRVLTEADFRSGARRMAEEIALLPSIDDAAAALVAMASG